MSATSKPIKIKEVIDTFCLLFRCHGYSKISAEILRQSKFNQRVVVIPLLDFVFNVLTKNLDHDLNSWNSSKKFMLVLSTLKEIDYPRTHLLFCKELIDMSSQELLLAFGYLLVKLDIIGKLRYDAKHYVSDAIIESCKPDTKSITESKISLNDSVRLTKKIEFLQRDLSTDSCYLEKLLRKFNQMDKEHLENSLMPHGTQNKDGAKKPIVKPSILDLIFFQNFKLQEHCIQLLKKQVEMLRIHNKWVQQESLFWKWLSSIPKRQQGVVQSAKAYTSGTALELIRQSDKHVSLTKFLGNVIRTALQQYEFDFDEESAQCRENLNESFKNSLDDLKSSIVKIEDENKKWLQNFVTDRFPNVVQLPELKR